MSTIEIKIISLLSDQKLKNAVNDFKKYIHKDLEKKVNEIKSKCGKETESSRRIKTKKA